MLHEPTLNATLLRWKLSRVTWHTDFVAATCCRFLIAFKNLQHCCPNFVGVGACNTPGGGGSLQSPLMKVARLSLWGFPTEQMRQSLPLIPTWAPHLYINSTQSSLGRKAFQNRIFVNLVPRTFSLAWGRGAPTPKQGKRFWERGWIFVLWGSLVRQWAR